jgi:hypothetical protein
MTAAIALVIMGAAWTGSAALAASPPPTPTPLPCLRTLKFGGSLYLDTDQVAPAAEVGPKVGETDPNPAHCGLPDRLNVYRHTGHNTTEDVVYYVTADQPEVFRSGGDTGFPMQSMLRWLVLVLAIGILAFAAMPAILAHLRQPPVEVGGAEDTDLADEPKIGVDGE